MKGLDAKKFFWILVAMNVLLVGATFMVFTQASSIGQNKSQKIAEYKVKDQANDQLISYYKVLQNNLAANKDIEGVIQKVLPADKDQSAALVDLDKFAKNNNITIQQLTFNPGTAKGAQTLVSPSTISGVSVISVSLSCSNIPYENLLNFLKTIETTQRRMQINSVNITPNTTNPELLDRVDMTLDIYLKAGK